MRNAPLNCVNWPAKFSKSRREATIKQLPLLSRDTQVAHQRRYYWRFARIEMIAKLLVAQRFLGSSLGGHFTDHADGQPA